VNSNTRLMLKEQFDPGSGRDPQKYEIAALVHLLRDQACTLSLGISALQYGDESEQERQKYVAVLESVVEEMNRQFHRLDQCLIQIGYKPGLGESSPRLASAGRVRKHRLCVHESRHNDLS
jgi:hypothetical protein